MSRYHVVRVFTDAEGGHGNELGVFLDGHEVPAPDRQRAAADLGFSETVFVEDRASARVRIFTPVTEFAFAGHPMVGTAWLMAEAGAAPAVLRPPAGEVTVRFEGGVTWITGRPEWAPGGEPVQLSSAAEVEALEPIAAGDVYYWAWIDEEAGTIRARCFAPDVGIAEDQGTGSAAIAVCGLLGRPIEIHQGAGSRLSASPLEDGWVEVGGRVAAVQTREWPVG